ncbi:MAG TPA: PAS domain-containing protein [Stellaceae bacterium]|nr:PAS domain-containing protein [Stellaceae bacterium]
MVDYLSKNSAEVGGKDSAMALISQALAGDAKPATAGARPELPQWMRRLSALAVLLAAAAVGFWALTFGELLAGRMAWWGTIVLGALAALAMVAACVARKVHRMFASRVDLLGSALEASPNAHLILAPNGSVAYANAAFLALFRDGATEPLDAIERRIGFGTEAAQEFHRLRDEAFGHGRAHGHILLRSGAGMSAWFNLSIHSLAGRPGFSLWSFEDVTARHEMEQVIRDEQMKLADFLDNAPSGFYSVDGEGRFLYANQALADWLGVPSTELVDGGARLRDFIASEIPPESPPHAPFLATGSNTQRGEVTFRGRQGRLVRAAVSQTVVQTEHGLRTRSVVRDLTREREWEEALRQSRQRFQRFFADAPTGVALLDPDGRFEEANRALGELFGVPPASLIGRKLVEFLSETDARDVTRRLAVTSESAANPRPIGIRLKGSRERSANVYLSRLDAQEDDKTGLILHFVDTTEQKNLETQFAQSQKMQAVGQLAGGVAHDFNNLLTAMIGFCDLLLLRFRPGDPSFADIMQIKQNANRAANLVRQLLAFSRQQTLQPRVLSITDVLAELSHLLRRLIGENIELKVVHGRDLGLVRVDQGQLEQVIINLAVNARDAMTSGGTLTIRTTNTTTAAPIRRGHEVMPRGDYILVQVADTGIGIPKENLERIFEPFFSTKEVGSGTGLGLSTVYGIVRQTGGFVFVDSEPGQGATFSIYLPRLDPNEATQTRADAGEAAGQGRDLTGAGTVLLVEDEDPVRLFSARALRNKGYRVLEAKSGEAALELLTQGKESIDLVVTDVVMPRMDGPALVRAVRETHPDMKVIFISGYTEDAFRKRLDSDTEIHFLPKPFSLKQLAGKVKEVISAEAPVSAK